MRINDSDLEVLAVKDAETERPIPSAWRPVFQDIVKAFCNHDYQLQIGIPKVAPISDSTAKHIEESIQNYGEKLTELPEETWRSSVCIWMGDRWDVLIDLWSLSEGPSDLVLSAQVKEQQAGLVFHVYMVYVP